MTTTISGSDIQDGNAYRLDAVHLIETQTASSSASIDFVLPSGYYKYEVIVSAAKGSTDNVDFSMRTSSDGGSTFDATAGDYSWGAVRLISSASGEGSTSDGEIVLRSTVGNGTNEHLDATVDIIDPSKSGWTAVAFTAIAPNATPTKLPVTGYGQREDVDVVNAIRFFFASGNIASGTFKLYGWVS